MRHQLVVNLDDAVFHVLSDVEPDYREIRAGLSYGINIFYTLDFP